MRTSPLLHIDSVYLCKMKYKPPENEEEASREGGRQEGRKGGRQRAEGG